MSERPIVWPGRPRPLGAIHDGRGTNFSVFSSTAEAVELCLFGDHDPAPGSGRGDEQQRIELTEVDAHCGTRTCPASGPGTRYGFRAHGRWAPDEGLWHNPAKLLLDPYARRIHGEVRWGPACFGYVFDDPDTAQHDDSAPHVPLVVVEPVLRLGSRPPAGPPHARDGHLRAARQGLHRCAPRHRPARGTYAGLAEPEVIDHLLRLGVTAVELQPVHSFIQDHHLMEKGLAQLLGLQLHRVLRAPQRLRA